MTHRASNTHLHSLGVTEFESSQHDFLVQIPIYESEMKYTNAHVARCIYDNSPRTFSSHEVGALSPQDRITVALIVNVK